jgi:hypothetical protein
MRNRASWLHKIIASGMVLAASAGWLATAAQAQTSYAATTGFGTFYKPFAADSPWNSRPVKPFLGTYQLKKPLLHPDWIPAIADGAYSVGVFMARASDGPMTIYGKAGTAGVGDPDTGKFHNITIPRWPANVVPATGEDGHAEVIDTVAGVVHSFFQLTNKNGKWTATMYAWTKLEGRGFGDPAHWSQGARSAGAPPTGGLIRLHELTDNKDHFDHALAMSLPSHTLANGITRASYVYPATTADTTAILNTGAIPLGTRLMLPASFNTATLSTPMLRKIANTLKMYGAYVVDRNYDTAFRLYVENGSNFSIMPNGQWSNQVVNDLDRIRAGMREVLGADNWLDGNGAPKGGPGGKGLLSMRGDWLVPGGSTPGNGSYDTWLQGVKFPVTATKINLVNYSNGISKVAGSNPAARTTMRFAAVGAGGAKIRLQLWYGYALAYDSGYLADGSHVSFQWPAVAPALLSVRLLAESGVGTASNVRGVLEVQ